MSVQKGMSTRDYQSPFNLATPGDSDGSRGDISGQIYIPIKHVRKLAEILGRVGSNARTRERFSQSDELSRNQGRDNPWSSCLSASWN